MGWTELPLAYGYTLERTSNDLPSHLILELLEGEVVVELHCNTPNHATWKSFTASPATEPADPRQGGAPTAPSPQDDGEPR